MAIVAGKSCGGTSKRVTRPGRGNSAAIREVANLTNEIVYAFKAFARRKAWSPEDFDRLCLSKLIKADQARLKKGKAVLGFHELQSIDPQYLEGLAALFGFSKNNIHHYLKFCPKGKHGVQLVHVRRIHAVLEALQITARQPPDGENRPTWLLPLRSWRDDLNKTLSSQSQTRGCHTEEPLSLLGHVLLETVDSGPLAPNEHPLVPATAAPMTALCSILKRHFGLLASTPENDVLCTKLQTDGATDPRFDTLSFHFQDYSFSIKRDALFELLQDIDRNCVFLAFIQNRDCFYLPVWDLWSNERVRDYLKASDRVPASAFTDVAPFIGRMSDGPKFAAALRQEAQRALNRRTMQLAMGPNRNNIHPVHLAVLLGPTIATVPILEMPADISITVRDKSIPEIEEIVRKIVFDEMPGAGTPIEAYFAQKIAHARDLRARGPEFAQFLEKELMRFLSACKGSEPEYFFPALTRTNVNFYRALFSKFPEESFGLLTRTAANSTNVINVRYACLMAVQLAFANDASISRRSADLIMSLFRKHAQTDVYTLHRELQLARLNVGLGGKDEAMSFIRRYAGSDSERAHLGAYGWLGSLPNNLKSKLYDYSAKDELALPWHQEMARALLPRKFRP